eukprot:2899613-Pleurochrysis_carterae.AAC.1
MSLEEVGPRQVDPFYGKNVWPSEALRRKTTAVNECMHAAALRVLAKCDDLVQSELSSQPPDRPSLSEIASGGSTLAGRWIWYDSMFSRDDDLLDGPRQKMDDPAYPVCSAEEQKCARNGSGETNSRLNGGQQSCLKEWSDSARAIAKGDGAKDAVTEASSDDALSSMRTHATATRTTG